MNSICIATFNGEKYINQQLTSILSQINIDDEIIISDDGSTDNTISIINALNDNRIKIIHSNFHYYKLNFENALKQAKGEYIFLADQDDVWLPNKYHECLHELKKYDLICHNSKITDKNLNIINNSFFNFYKSGKGIIKNIINSSYFGACMAFNRKILNSAIPFPKTKEFGHDIWLGLVAESIGKVKFIETPYLLYRRHNDTFTNISNNLLTRSKRPLLKKIWSRITLAYHLIIFNIQYFTCKKI